MLLALAFGAISPIENHIRTSVIHQQKTTLVVRGAAAGAQGDDP